VLTPQTLAAQITLENWPTLRPKVGRSVCSCCQTAYTVGRRAFSVAGARVWNALPGLVH